MSKFTRRVFPELADKRLSELTPAQRDDVNEDWIRANQEFTVDPKTVEFLLLRLDAMRVAHVSFRAMHQFVITCAEFHDEFASKRLALSGGTDYSWFDNPSMVRAARELLKRLDIPRS